MATSQMKRRIIVGIMGGDEQPKEAAALGSWVVASGHILLTGGRPIDDATTKNAAMFGAVSHMHSQGTARLIGIQPSRDIEWNTPNRHQLFLGTGLGSIERDPLTGMTPDILIFMRGGTGTLLEMAYASASGKPMIFCDSSVALRRKVKQHREDGTWHTCVVSAFKCYPSVRGKILNTNELDRIVDEAFAGAREMSSKDLSPLSHAIAGLPLELPPVEFPGIPQDDKPSIERFSRIVDMISGDE